MSEGYTANYTYNDDGSLYEMSAAGLTMEYTYDELKRLEGTYYHSTGGFSFGESYTFVSPGNLTTTLVSTYSISGGDEYEYYYDERGNIIEEIINWEYDYPVYYEYDDLGQLLWVGDCYHQIDYFYTYDSAGNITSAEMTAASVDGFYNTYGYTDSQWGDLLTSFNGVTITYDDIGNPTSYYNGTSYSFTWEGRRLVGATSAGKTYSFTYNDDGIRTSKTVNGVEHKYYLSGDRIIAEEWDGDMLVYVYDATGSPIGMMYYMGYFSTSFCEKYWFEKNIWGDITAVYDDAGNLIIEYSYDPYGNCTETVLSNSYGARYNPFRYRGYYYDADLGLYYLNSRYYDSNTCRFINADGVSYLGANEDLVSYNLYAYCSNNPIAYTDPSGHCPEWVKNSIKWVSQNIIRPVVKTVQDALSEIDATYSGGINFSGTPSIIISGFQSGVSIDTKGNVAIQNSTSAGITGGSSGVSITAYQSITNAPNVNKLEGSAYQLGASGGVPINGFPFAMGCDLEIIPDSNLNTSYLGLTTNLGIGTPGGELHVSKSKTNTWNNIQFNVFDIAEKIYNRIMEW